MELNDILQSNELPTELGAPFNVADAQVQQGSDALAVANVTEECQLPVSGEDTGSQNRRSRFLRVLAPALAVGALSFQQTPANELARTAITTVAFENSDSKEIAAAASGVATLAIEGGTASLIALGIRRKGAIDNLLSRYRKRKSAKKEIDDATKSVEKNVETKTERVKRIATDIPVALLLGPGLVVVKRHLKENDRTLKEDLRTGWMYSALGSVVSAGVFGYGLTEGIDNTDKMGFMKTPVEFALETVTDIRLWLLGALTATGVAVKRKLFNRVKNVVPEESRGL